MDGLTDKVSYTADVSVVKRIGVKKESFVIRNRKSQNLYIQIYI